MDCNNFVSDCFFKSLWSELLNTYCSVLETKYVREKSCGLLTSFTRPLQLCINVFFCTYNFVGGCYGHISFPFTISGIQDKLDRFFSFFGAQRC